MEKRMNATTIEIDAGTAGVFEVNQPSTDAVVVNATLGSAALQLTVQLSN